MHLQLLCIIYGGASARTAHAFNNGGERSKQTNHAFKFPL